MKFLRSSMGVDGNSAKFALLQILAANPDISTLKLDSAGWDELMSIADQHLLLPLMHRQLADARATQAVSADLQQVLRNEFRASAMRSLQVLSALKRVDSILRHEGIAYVALKGSRLAWSSYPDPAMRPMRDIDVLVKPEEAVRAHQLLLANGCCRLDVFDQAEEVSIASGKHLPPLLDEVSGVCIEVHIRIFRPALATNPDAAMLQSGVLIDRRITLPLSGLDLPVLPAEEALVHCLVHAVYDSRCTSGPILLSDVRYLLANESMNWPRFWELAEEAGWARGCLLALKLAVKVHGPLPIEWPDIETGEISQDLLDDFSFALMSDNTRKQEIFVETSWPYSENESRLAFYVRKTVPTKQKLKNFARTESDSPLVWGVYPAWLTYRIWRFVRTMFSVKTKRNIKVIRNVRDWIHYG